MKQRQKRKHLENEESQGTAEHGGGMCWAPNLGHKGCCQPVSPPGRWDGEACVRRERPGSSECCSVLPEGPQWCETAQEGRMPPEAQRVIPASLRTPLLGLLRPGAMLDL